MSVRRYTCLAVLICLIAGSAYAQSGSVRGRVVDPQRVAVEGATVTLSGPANESAKSAK